MGGLGKGRKQSQSREREREREKWVLSASSAIFKPSRLCAAILSRLVRRVLPPLLRSACALNTTGAKIRSLAVCGASFKLLAFILDVLSFFCVLYVCSLVREPSAPLLRILGLLRIYIPAVSERVNVFSLVHVLCVCVYVFHFRISKYDTISLPHLPKTLLIYPYRHSSSRCSYEE